MAVYKVPQDVETEDKLLGPFSFKQFIFLLITVAMLGSAYALAQIVLPLALLPLPIAAFFAILALPLKKDQPMEVYLAAVVSFMTKPKKRLWEPDGIESLIEVVAPRVEEKQYGKGYNQEEVQQRLSYLANLVDSHGWSVRGVADPNSSMQDDLYNEAQAANDMLDDDNTTSRQIDNLVNQADQKRHQAMIQKMQQSAPSSQSANTQPPLAVADPYQNINRPDQSNQINYQQTNNLLDSDISLKMNPYPNMQQSVIAPMSEKSPEITSETQSTQTTGLPNTSPTAVSPAIIDLASNHSDLSIETLQREADRLEKKSNDLDEEVVISLH